MGRILTTLNETITRISGRIATILLLAFFLFMATSIVTRQFFVSGSLILHELTTYSFSALILILLSGH